tara:strand:+ start:60 stop:185 length:126 start_codon:yes stop_codon:yes gene_type:complete
MPAGGGTYIFMPKGAFSIPHTLGYYFNKLYNFNTYSKVKRE